MNGLSSKKILILGATVNEGLIVKRAKELGLYTIVTDNNSDWQKSPAKYLADEAWDISWSDIDKLSDECKKNGIDGVVAGFSEFRVENQIKLCSLLGLPCYITQEQLEITRNKTIFKEYCRLYDVPVVPEYDINGDIIDFPVIVKPVDRAGSIGIDVVYSKSELMESIANAQRESPSGKVIVEKYMSECVKFDAYYIIQHGEVILVGTNDTVMCPFERGYEVLQAAWIFPSRYEKDYIGKVDKAVKKMLKGMRIVNGYITISGFIDKNHDFYIFETGFRLSGELSYKYTDKKYGVNYLDMLIEHSINGDIIGYNYGMIKNENLRSLVINYYGLNGIIFMKKGMEQIGKIPDVDFTDYLVHSSEIMNMNHLYKKIGMCWIFADSIDSLYEKLLLIVDAYDVLDSNNQSLVYHKFRIENLLNYFNVDNLSTGENENN